VAAGGGGSGPHPSRLPHIVPFLISLLLQVDAGLLDLQQRKAGGGASAGPSPAELAAEGLRLRSEMQRAAEEERYADAARYRDLLAELDRLSKREGARESERGGAAPPRLRLGQRVVHRTHGYRGAVVGWDAACCESDEWAAGAGVADAPRGAAQPFYHILVESSDWEPSADAPPVAYAAEDWLSAPELDDAQQRSWIEARARARRARAGRAGGRHRLAANRRCRRIAAPY
jgi:hemimethylated DNA binding protein